MAGKVESHAAVPGFRSHLLEGQSCRKIPGIAYQNIQTTKIPHNEVDSLPDRLIVGHITAKSHQSRFVENLFHFGIQVQSQNRCTLLMQSFCACPADAAGCAGNQGDLSLEVWRLPGFSQFGLLEFPVFHLEQVLLRKCLPTAPVFHLLDRLAGMPDDVRNDGGFLDASAEGEGPVFFPDRPPWCRVEAGQLPVSISFEIIQVLILKGFDRFYRIFIQHHRDVFGS